MRLEYVSVIAMTIFCCDDVEFHLLGGLNSLNFYRFILILTALKLHNMKDCWHVQSNKATTGQDNEGQVRRSLGQGRTCTAQ